MSNKVQCKCKFCGKPISISKSEYDRGRGRFCSNSCKGKYQVATNPPDQKGQNNSQWHGGRYIENSYVKIFAPDHPFNNGSHVFEHRLVMEQKYGRYLTKNELVHHINFIKDDNREENLIVLSACEHSKLHWKLKKSGLNIHELPFETLKVITYNLIKQIRGITNVG